MEKELDVILEAAIKEKTLGRTDSILTERDVMSLMDVLFRYSTWQAWRNVRRNME